MKNDKKSHKLFDLATLKTAYCMSPLYSLSMWYLCTQFSLLDRAFIDSVLGSQKLLPEEFFLIISENYIVGVHVFFLSICQPILPSNSPIMCPDSI